MYGITLGKFPVLKHLSSFKFKWYLKVLLLFLQLLLQRWAGKELGSMMKCPLCWYYDEVFLLNPLWAGNLKVYQCLSRSGKLSTHSRLSVFILLLQKPTILTIKDT